MMMHHPDDDRSDDDSHKRRESDRTRSGRLTGMPPQQLATQIISGLLLAGVVGLLSAWGVQQAMTEQLKSLSHQLDDVRLELRQMRQDLYAPRWRGASLALRPPAERLAPGRP